MPNWCSGNIRFRGKLEDIYQMLENELKYCYDGNDGTTHEINCSLIPRAKDPWLIEVVAPEVSELKETERCGWWYFNETRRAFPTEHQTIEVQMWDRSEQDEDIYIAYMDDFRQAWGIFAEDFVRYSKEYNLDIHIFGWECGMCFSQEVEIINGEIVKNESQDYEEWGWDSPLPIWGG